jgi:hypothetical protein
MKQQALTEAVRVSGKIVEICEREGTSLVRVSLNPCCIEVMADPTTELHLGEKVTIDVQIRTRTVRPASMLPE